MAIRATISVDGVENVKKAIRVANRKTKSAIAAAVFQKANKIAKNSHDRTPKDTGALRKSLYVRPPRVGAATTEVGYGQDYAIHVHERTELQHDVGEARFLAKAIQEESNGYAKDIARMTRRNIKNGTTISGVARKFEPSPKIFPRR